MAAATDLRPDGPESRDSARACEPARGHWPARASRRRGTARTRYEPSAAWPRRGSPCPRRSAARRSGTGCPGPRVQPPRGGSRRRHCGGTGTPRGRPFPAPPDRRFVTRPLRQSQPPRRARRRAPGWPQPWRRPRTARPCASSPEGPWISPAPGRRECAGWRRRARSDRGARRGSRSPHPASAPDCHRPASPPWACPPPSTP